MMINDKGWKVRLRDGFSERSRIKQENTEMQFVQFDERSRIALSNGLTTFWEDYFQISYEIQNELVSVLLDIASNVYVVDLASIDRSKLWKITEQMRSTIRTAPYYEVLDLIEYVCAKLFETALKYNKGPYCPIHEKFNNIFKAEYIGYRFVGRQIVQITNEEEIQEIENALTIGLEPVEEHLNKALSFLSDRNSPDFENSIKESISSVEAMAKLLSGEKSKLHDALVAIQKKSGVKIHPGLVVAFDKLYGYTSDSSGIRHAAKMGEPGSTFEEARFMLVACSAFVNYLKAFMSGNV